MKSKKNSISIENTRNTATLAKQLGLSRWTVSRVINGHPGVRPETTQRVLAAMSKLGYEPNAFARGLRGGRTGMVGICFQELDNPILTRKASLLQAFFREQGYHAMIELTNGDQMREAEAIRDFLGLRVEGIVLLGSALKTASTGDVPVVWVDPEQKVDGEQISVDRGYSMKLVLEHLHALGHRKYGVLGIDPENPYGAFRLPAFKRSCQRLRIDVDKDTYSIYQPGRPDHTYEYGRELAEAFLEQSPIKATAVIALNDRVAIGAINHFRSKGLRIPEDISVTGYDNLDVAAHFQPSLTTIDQCETKLMHKACDALISRIEGGKSEVKRRLIRPELIIRDSTASLQ